MDQAKVAVASPVKRFAMVALGNGGKWAKRGKELAIINPYTITADLEKMFLITQFLTSHSSMEFLGRAVGFSVGCIGGIAGANQWKDNAVVIKGLDDILTEHSRKKLRQRGHVRSIRCRRSEVGGAGDDGCNSSWITLARQQLDSKGE